MAILKPSFLWKFHRCPQFCCMLLATPDYHCLWFLPNTKNSLSPWVVSPWSLPCFQRLLTSCWDPIWAVCIERAALKHYQFYFSLSVCLRPAWRYHSPFCSYYPFPLFSSFAQVLRSPDCESGDRPLQSAVTLSPWMTPPFPVPEAT